MYQDYGTWSLNPANTSRVVHIETVWKWPRNTRGVFVGNIRWYIFLIRIYIFNNSDLKTNGIFHQLPTESTFALFSLLFFLRYRKNWLYQTIDFGALLNHSKATNAVLRMIYKYWKRCWPNKQPEQVSQSYSKKIM